MSLLIERFEKAALGVHLTTALAFTVVFPDVDARWEPTFRTCAVACYAPLMQADCAEIQLHESPPSMLF